MKSLAYGGGLLAGASEARLMRGFAGRSTDCFEEYSEEMLLNWWWFSDCFRFIWLSIREGRCIFNEEFRLVVLLKKSFLLFRIYYFTFSSALLLVLRALLIQLAHIFLPDLLNSFQAVLLAGRGLRLIRKEVAQFLVDQDRLGLAGIVKDCRFRFIELWAAFAEHVADPATDAVHAVLDGVLHPDGLS